MAKRKRAKPIKSLFGRSAPRQPEVREIAARTVMRYTMVVREIEFELKNMESGKYGDVGRRMLGHILAEEKPNGIIDALSRKGWKREKFKRQTKQEKAQGKEREERGPWPWEADRNEFLKKNGFLFGNRGKAHICTINGREIGSGDECEEGTYDIGPVFWEAATKAAVGHIRSWLTKHEKNKKALRAWRRRRAAWIKKNPEAYAFLCGPYQDFLQQQEEQRLENGSKAFPTRKKRGRKSLRNRRWQAWHDWLKENAGTAIAWKDPSLGEKDVVPVPEKEMAKIIKSRPERRQGKEFNAFRKHNPEIDKLCKIMDEWFDRFAKSPRYPTWTPAGPNNLVWPCLKKTTKASGLYRNFEYKNHQGKGDGSASGTIEVQLLGEEGRQWVKIELVLDRRFDERYRKRRGMPSLGDVQIKGITLLAKRSMEFRFVEERKYHPIILEARAEKESKDDKKNRLAQRIVPREFAVYAIDQGLRYPAAEAALHAVRKRNGDYCYEVIHAGLLPGHDIPSLLEVEKHKKQLNELLRGSRPVRGKTRHRALRAHISNMIEDYKEKVARRCIDRAVEFGAGAFAGEDLRNIEKPSYKLKRWRNKKMMMGIFSGICTKLKGMESDEGVGRLLVEFGIRCSLVHAAYTSATCHGCGARVYRYHVKDNKPVPDSCGEWAFCPGCDNTWHSDVNAAINIGARFLGAFSRTKEKFDKDKFGGLDRGMLLDGARDAMEEISRQAACRNDTTREKQRSDRIEEPLEIEAATD
jgi:hypothetical protein